MAYTIYELINVDFSDRRAREAQRQREKEEAEDAYWNAMGDLIEQHPIGLPGNPRLLKS